MPHRSSNLPGVLGTTPWPPFAERLTILWFGWSNLTQLVVQMERQNVGCAHRVPVRTQTADRADIVPRPRSVLVPAPRTGARRVCLTLQLHLDPVLTRLVYQSHRSPHRSSGPLPRGQVIEVLLPSSTTSIRSDRRNGRRRSRHSTGPTGHFQ